MDARLASFERLDSQLERQDALNSGFIPCNSHTNDATLCVPLEPNSKLATVVSFHGEADPSMPSISSILVCSELGGFLSCSSNVDADATGVSNSGKRKKFVAKQDVVVDGIADFSTQLIDVERSRQACESEREENNKKYHAIVDEREVSFQTWQMQMEEKKMEAAEKRNNNICSTLELCPPDSSILIGVLCAIQTVLEYYEEEENMLSEGPAKRLKTCGIYLPATPVLSRCFLAIVAQFLLLPSAIASGDRFGIGESTVQEIMREGIEAIIAELGPEYLKWPSTSEMIKVSNGFQLRSGLPNVQGAVDGTFIRIRAPPSKEVAIDYYNRKGYHAIVL
ncbi:hypothetical protein R1flu_024788 [Riccia fluitans]|uniref:Transposase n=1 Tax=Riccia fluitans TaxID=41844 RepID=A0ABD1XYX1_9MARC